MPLACAAVALAIIAQSASSVVGRDLVLGPGVTGDATVFVLTTLVLSAPVLLLARVPKTAWALLLAGTAVVPGIVADRGIPLLQFLLVGVAAGHIAATRSRRESSAVCAVTAVVLAAWAYAWPAGNAATVVAEIGIFLAVLAWSTGRALGRRRAYQEHARAYATDEAVIAERLRIARELHDMVAHSVGIIAIQAGVGRRVIDTRPAEARDALAAIEETSRETLAGMRRTVTALRRTDPRPADRAAPRDPAPGLADVERLAEATRDAGVRVEVRWSGPRPKLPPDLDMSAYRIVQEAVTNVVRHAKTDHCRVTIARDADALTLDIVDDGRGGTPDGGGYGLVGIRERVGLLHGEVTAGPRPEGGFRVGVRLPLPAASPASPSSPSPSPSPEETR